MGETAAPNQGKIEATGGLMVLVDTSVWVRCLSGRAPYAHGLDDLLSRGEDAHLLASALVGRLGLWTADARLAVVARGLGVS